MKMITIKSIRKYSNGKKMESIKAGGQMAIKSIYIILNKTKALELHKQWHSNGELFTLKNFKTGRRAWRAKILGSKWRINV